MPTYEYECTACHHRFEVRQKFSDDPLTVCPQCSGTLRRVFHVPAGVHFSWNPPSFLDSEERKQPSSKYSRPPEEEFV
jgi:putative FmdB family regulatory protein